VLLWYYLDDPKLSAFARTLLLDAMNVILVSPASHWEIAIKVGKGQYSFSKPFLDVMHEAIDLNGFQVLPVEPRHTVLLTTLPHHHKDPFDRLLIAQALAENVPIISIDQQFDAYGVQRLWLNPPTIPTGPTPVPTQP
jgi:PIN domain nuclease of toxin-antitoxin system